MSRITKDDLKYCTKFNWCWNCYKEEKDVQAIGLQLRGKLQVPSCRKHFYDYADKMRLANALEYAQLSERKQKERLCSRHGCYAKLIPRELRPPWARHELTCGRHGTLKAFLINRIAIMQFILDCLTPEECEAAVVQNVIYKRGQGLAYIGIKYPNRYETRVCSASGLERRITGIRSQDFPTGRSLRPRVRT